MIRGALRRHELLADLTDWELERLAAMTREQRVAAGTVLASQGEPATDDRACAWIVNAGEVRITRDDDAGQRIADVRVGAGALIGVIALVLDHARSASLSAATDVRVVRIDRTAFDAMYETDSRLAVKFRVIVARQLARDLRRINSGIARASNG
ncbi:MAG: cyclic nucleotide-binding domain-containing protein [Myxococcales bacterium]|nr:cyclic nucleotide-binding domain-containing protein [Myxococcales bacterium]MCB9521353.1 cyclic nucleotide-binding domain-containing protein [Myxococcales bacterium]